MNNRIVAVLLFWIFYTLITFAQDLPDTSHKTAQGEYAKVYIYRLDDGDVFGSLFVKTSPVYFGSGENTKTKLRKIAGLRNKHYFMMRLPAGKYSFDTRLMEGRVNLEVKDGGEYYLHLDRGNDCGSEHPQDIFRPPSSRCQTRSATIKQVKIPLGQDDLKKLTPIKEKDIKDKKQVIIPPFI